MYLNLLFFVHYSFKEFLGINDKSLQKINYTIINYKLLTRVDFRIFN